MAVIIDKQVAADADDGYVTGASINSAVAKDLLGTYGGSDENSWYRWTGITIPKKSTISTAKITLLCGVSIVGLASRMWFEKANDAAAPTTAADYNGKTLTSLHVDWLYTGTNNNWVDSPELKTLIQELVNAFGFVNQHMQCLHKNNGSAFESGNYDYHYAVDQGAKLHIEYTPPGAGGAVSITRKLIAAGGI